MPEHPYAFPFNAVQLETCLKQPVQFSALFGARLPVFPSAHAAKVAKLALPGSNKATFTLQSPGKTLDSSRCRF
jgi:hypothetical protein